jgi:hypothetical protein
MGGMDIRRKGFWRLVSQSRVVFTKAVVPLVIAFCWGVVLGFWLNYRPVSNLDKALDYAQKRAQQILQENQGSAAAGYGIDGQLRSVISTSSAGRAARND